MFNSKYDPDKNFSFMDGIPVKISEQYKPPKKISVPSSILNRNMIKVEEYDFRLEKSMVTKMDEWRQLHRINVDKRKQRLELEDHCGGNGESKCIGGVTEIIPKLRVQSPEPSEAHQPLDETSKPVPVSQQEIPQSSSYQMKGESGVPRVHSHSDPILMPIPVPHNSITSHNPYNQTVLKKSFNISDFESDTSSPFDNMELKTLNDLAELATVLQPNLNTHNCDVQCSSSQNLGQEINSSVTTHLTCSGEPLVSPDCKKAGDMYSSKINGMNSLYYDNFNSLNSNSIWPHYSTFNFRNGNVNHNSYVGARNSWAQSSILPSSYNPNSQSYVVQRLDCLETDQKPQQHHLHDSQLKTVSTETSSKSVPDFIQELILELKDKRASEEQKSKQILDEASLSSRSVQIEEKKGCCSLPNPFNDLAPPSQQLTGRLTEMGFPEGRVARAIQQFGDNETRVLEFLFQVQHLEEQGWPPDRVEIALIANKFNLSDTIQFLETMKQLLDLGFVEKDVVKALEKHSNDRDKALESLIS